jgi:hypothetical protein
MAAFVSVEHPLCAEVRPSQTPPAAPQRVQVCTLVPKEEVKKHLPWNDMLDRMPVEETPIGADGSSCEFPTVGVQVLRFSQSFIDGARKSAPLEAISGLGDEAYFRNNQNRWAEVLVKVGPRLLTLQASIDGQIEAVKPRVIELAKVYVAKLR